MVALHMRNCYNGQASFRTPLHPHTTDMFNPGS